MREHLHISLKAFYIYYIFDKVTMCLQNQLQKFFIAFNTQYTVARLYLHKTTVYIFICRVRFCQSHIIEKLFIILAIM